MKQISIKDLIKVGDCYDFHMVVPNTEVVLCRQDFIKLSSYLIQILHIKEVAKKKDCELLIYNKIINEVSSSDTIVIVFKQNFNDYQFVEDKPKLLA